MRNLLLAGVMSFAVHAAPNDIGGAADDLAAKRKRIEDLTTKADPTDDDRDEIARLQADVAAAVTAADLPAADATGSEVRTGADAAVPGVPDLIVPAGRSPEQKLPDPAITAPLVSGLHPNPPTHPDNAGLATSTDPGAAKKAADRARARRAAKDPDVAARLAMEKQAIAEANDAVEDKQIVFLLSRDRDPRFMPDFIVGQLERLRVAPRDGFAVRAVGEDADNGVPAHLRVSFDPILGFVDRDLVVAMLAKPIADALAV